MHHSGKFNRHGEIEFIIALVARVSIMQMEFIIVNVSGNTDGCFFVYASIPFLKIHCTMLMQQCKEHFVLLRKFS